ncbi:multifunctional CCA addition/repair protein [Salinispirillum sp. LH 10-3-1]|uniref:Multifunctional CCA protein n=1 Tax=Salinispirillum sp. LH 10-3-1 TaxID=2952525 RepID=A0AB38YI79_9GAMM
MQEDISSKSYLVGGAVRDRLLHLPVKDRDWVVVGATPDELLRAGYRQVGADFPVFLHPESQEEYALARTERKSGLGYQGFICDFSPDISLEDDLLRRDLTINAMAEATDGTLVDPYGGAQDLQARLLRHVSPAFAEDPLRVLRVARFAARFADLGFEIAPETLALMKAMVESGELANLTPERAWQETEKALLSNQPSVYFMTLRQVGALHILMPELDALFGVPQTMRFHPEVDTGMHTMMALDAATTLTDRIDVRFAVLCHDFGKAATDTERLPSHHGHERSGVARVDAACKRLKVSKRLHQLARLTAEWHTHCHRVSDLKPSTVLKVLEAFRALQDGTQLEGFVLACKSDARGRSGYDQLAYEQADWLLAAREAAVAVSTKPLLERGLKGPALGDALRKARTLAIGQVLTPLRQ